MIQRVRSFSVKTSNAFLLTTASPAKIPQSARTYGSVLLRRAGTVARFGRAGFATPTGDGDATGLPDSGMISGSGGTRIAGFPSSTPRVARRFCVELMLLRLEPGPLLEVTPTDAPLDKCGSLIYATLDVWRDAWLMGIR